jgi:hypothetical protein
VNQKPLVDLVRRMLFQLFILRPGLTQHGNIGVRVLSQRQKILIRRLGSRLVPADWTTTSGPFINCAATERSTRWSSGIN